MEAENRQGLAERNGLLSGTNDALFAENERLKAEIERLKEQLKLAVFSDSEECKLVNKDNEKLRIEIERLKEALKGLMDELIAQAHAWNPERLDSMIKARAALSQKEGE